MKRVAKRCLRTWLAPALVGLLATSAVAQTFPGNRKMAEPSPQLPGDSAMTCDQLVREMHDIMKKNDIGKTASQNLETGCAVRRTAPTAAEYVAMTAPTPTAAAAQRNKAAEMGRALAPAMANAMTTMTALNDPRLMRLAMLAEEKHCAADEPTAQSAEQADPCSDTQSDAPRGSPSTPGSPDSADLFSAVRSSPPAPGGVSDPFVQPAAQAAPTVPVMTPPK